MYIYTTLALTVLHTGWSSTCCKS